jgi:hypothetical protein
VIAWTLTAGVTPEGAGPGEVYWEVNGEASDANSPHQDPHDPRHFPSLEGAIHFLLHKMRRGDTLHFAGADTGRILRIGYVRVGDAIEFDVGTRQIPNPEQLVDWISMTLQKGDTISYLPQENSHSQMGELERYP